MKKALLSLFALMLVLTSILGLASCGADVEFNVNFVVDGELYASVGTSGEETIKIPNNPTKEGYAFDGWYWDNGTWQKPFTANSLLDAPLSSDMSVYAKWKENTPICQHRDADDNSLCDKCGESYTDGKDIDDSTPCSHRDADDNSLCDKCGEGYTDGKDLFDEHTHSYTVKNTDSKYLDKSADCENAATYFYSCSCGAKGTETFTSGSENGHSYTVKNTDSKYLDKSADCENAATYYYSCSCGAKGSTTFAHGNSLGHRDANDNNLCDKCNKPYTDGTDVIVPAESISFDNATASIEVGDTVTLIANFSPSNTTDKTLTWISSDTSIAMVTNGIVLGIKPGSTTIIAMTANGKTATCLVNVSPKTYYAESITLNKSELELAIGYSYTLSATVLPDYTTDKTVTWSSSDSSIVKVENGKVTAVSAGTATITATASNGKSASCTVTSLFVSATDIIIGEQIVYVDAGKSTTVNATSVPENATISSLVWSSSDTNIATVKDGVITGVADGIAVITVSTADGRITKKFNVVVENSAEIVYTSYGSGYSVSSLNKITDTVIIPDTYKGKPVTSISSGVFGTECYVIKNLYIGKNITSLSAGILKNCTKLETLSIPGVEYDYIGDLFGTMSITWEGGIDNFSPVDDTYKYNGYYDFGYEVPQSYTDWYIYHPNRGWYNVNGVYVFVKSDRIAYANISSWQTYTVTYYSGSYLINVDSYKVPKTVNLTAYRIPKTLTNIYESDGNAIALEANSACVDKVKDLRVAFNGVSKPLAELISLSDLEKIKTAGTYDLTVYFNGYIGTVRVTITGHTASPAVEENYVDSNCTQTGSYDSVCYCYSCKAELSREKKTVAAKGHDYVDHESKAVTCLNIGWDAYQTCSHCDYTSYEEIGALGHDYVHHDAKAKTCTNVGWEAYDSCSRCDYTTYVEIPASHNPKSAVTENIIESKCNEDGSYQSVVYCADCKKELSRTNNEIKRSHKMSSGSCTVCGLQQSSNGLSFTLNSDGKGYTLTGIGSCTSKNIVIGVYNNLSVTSISSSAFYNCRSLTSVTIPDSVTSIGERAFYDCDSLTSVTIGNSVTSIGNSAFYGCYKLVEVINKSSLNIVTGSSSYGYVAYYAKEVHKGDGKIVNKDNYLFYTYNGVNYLLGYVGNDTALTLPENYNGQSYEIYNYAFYSCSRLTSVTIPDSVTSIGSSAFRKCTSLTSVTIGNGVTSIGEYAFGYCGKLTSVTIPDSVTSIGSSAFSDCTALEEIYFNATAMKDLSNSNYVFYNAGKDGNGIKVVIGNNVTKMPAYLFCPRSSSYSPKIISVEFEEGSVCESIGDYAFYFCYSLKSVTIPDSVTSIGSSAFKDCDSLTSVTIPDSVESIGYSAFWGCTSLKSVTIPYSVTSIGNYALYGCDSLTSVTIPDSVTSIGEYAFGYCGKLTSVTIPDSVTSIGSSAFKYCTSLMSVTIGNGVTSIGDYAFYFCYSLISVTIPDSVTSIGSSAFEYCYKLVEVINKSSLNIVTGSSSYGYVAYYTKEVHKGDSKIVNKDNYLFYTYNGVNYLLGYVGNDTSLTLPENYNGQNYEIYNYAFRSCTSLTSVTIPDSVTSIGELAFYCCTSLTSVTIPNSVTSIGSNAFYDCDSLTSVTIPNSVTSIGSNAFYDCDSLTSVTIPNSVTSIGYSAFYGCDSLTSVTIGNGVTSIGSYAFGCCDKLTSIVFEDDFTWYLTSGNSTGKINTSATNSSTNATYFKSTYCNYDWYKK